MKWMLSLLPIYFGLSPSRLEAECPPTDPPPNIVVEASISTAGPYGEFWEVSIDPEGELHLVVLYMTDPLGHFCGEFHVGKARLEELQHKVNSSSYFDLPEQIEPTEVPFHAPDLRLMVKHNGQEKSVALYNPDAVLEGPQKTRFMEIWNAVFAMLPVKPKW